MGNTNIIKKPKYTQPFSLYLFSLVDLWERYGFYTIRSILVLYMTKIFLFSNAHAYSIFSAFTALLYLTPMLGGHIADKILGANRAVIIGGSILSLGYALLGLSGTTYFYSGLGTIIVGNGLFMPNIATMVSSLYKKGDLRREGGFSIFYTAINIGAFIPPIVTAFVIYKFGWHAAFLMATAGVLLSVIIFILGTRKNKINSSTNETKLKLNIRHVLISIFSIGLVIITLMGLVKYFVYTNIVVFLFSSVFVAYTLYRCFKYPNHQRNRLISCLLLIILSITFGVLYQQAGMSFTIYTEFNVERHIGSWLVPTVMFQSLNPLYIILLGPIFAKLWIILGKKRLNPSVSAKFGLGTLIMGSGFTIMPFAILTHSSIGLINLWWIALSYLLQTIGELFVSPIGLSMVSELSPVKMVGLMMGTWYFATSVADALAGFVSRWATIPSGSNNPLITSPIYLHVFGTIGIISILMGIGILFLVRFINTMMNEKLSLSTEN